MSKKYFDELVDILAPPKFTPTGVIKTKDQAYDNNQWIATFNFWIIQDKPQPAILFQQRGFNMSLAPGLLDVTVGGHYRSGEKMFAGMREVQEELGKKYDQKKIVFLGRRIYLGHDTQKRLRQNIVYVFATIDNSPLTGYKLQQEELAGLFILPITELIKVFTKADYSFLASGINPDGRPINIKVTVDSFPYNWDNYFYRLAVLAKRIIKAEKHLTI